MIADHITPDINPKGLVPAVEYQGKALYESLVLCEFLEDAYPSYKPHILPEEPYTRAYARIWVDFVSKNLVPAFMRLLQAQDPEKRKEFLQDYIKEQKKFAEQVKGPYFLGEEFSLVDVAIAPWIARDYILAEHRAYQREDAGEAWKKYAEIITQRPSVRATSSVSHLILVNNREILMHVLQEHKYYDEIYGRYLRDEAQSEGAKAIRAGRPIP